jgi:hypothetical protein
MEEQRMEKEVLEHMSAERDPIKEFEASKLFDIQGGAGFNFKVVDGVTRRLVMSEDKDYKNKVKRVIVNGDQ